MIDLKKDKKIHLVGIKGVGMASLAGILVKNGFLVSGSDVSEDFITTEKSLEKLDIKINDFLDVDLSSIDLIIKSNAYNVKNNNVIKLAKSSNIPIISYSDAVSYFFNSVYGIAVSGSHGKTTTTAMLACVLDGVDMDTTAIVGSKVISWESGYIAGNIKDHKSVFVLEADEYKKAFLKYRPKGAIITSIDYDHPDCYKNEKEYRDAFIEFIKNIPKEGFLVINQDIKDLDKIIDYAKCKIIFYSKGKMENFNLKFPGVFNQLNANAAYLVALELGVSKKDAKNNLEGFKGTARRFEILKKEDGLVVVDDYAHHPSEIKATLSGARSIFKQKKIVAIFQPHTYSRTKKFSKDFEMAFSDAQEVVITDIYSSVREVVDLSVNIKEITSRIGDKAKFIENKNDIEKYLKKCKNTDTVLIFMGAGDIWKIAHKI